MWSRLFAIIFWKELSDKQLFESGIYRKNLLEIQSQLLVKPVNEDVHSLLSIKVYENKVLNSHIALNFHCTMWFTITWGLVNNFILQCFNPFS